MTNRKVLLALFTTVLIICNTIILTQAANTRSSQYLYDYASYIDSDVNGDVYVSFEVTGRSTMDKIGASIIYLYEKAPGASSWTLVKTFIPQYHPEMMGYNLDFYTNYVSYDGNSNNNYKATVTISAEKDDGGDSRIIYTNIL